MIASEDPVGNAWSFQREDLQRLRTAPASFFDSYGVWKAFNFRNYYQSRLKRFPDRAWSKFIRPRL